VRDLPLPAPGEGAILGPTATPNPGNVGQDMPLTEGSGRLIGTWQLISIQFELADTDRH
jgi:hypothetical protein